MGQIWFRPLNLQKSRSWPLAPKNIFIDILGLINKCINTRKKKKNFVYSRKAHIKVSEAYITLTFSLGICGPSKHQNNMYVNVRVQCYGPNRSHEMLLCYSFTSKCVILLILSFCCCCCCLFVCSFVFPIVLLLLFLNCMCAIPSLLVTIVKTIWRTLIWWYNWISA